MDSLDFLNNFILKSKSNTKNQFLFFSPREKDREREKRITCKVSEESSIGEPASGFMAKEILTIRQEITLVRCD